MCESDNNAKTQGFKAVEVPIKVMVPDDLTISDNVTARIEAIYNQFAKSHADSIPENLSEDLQQETAVAVLEAMMSIPDDEPLNQSKLYEIVSTYLTAWLASQSDPDEYISLQDVLRAMNTEEDDGFMDLDDVHCYGGRKMINIVNQAGGTIMIRL